MVDRHHTVEVVLQVRVKARDNNCGLSQNRRQDETGGESRKQDTEEGEVRARKYR